MKEELYIDIVSKTIIARMSESVAQFAGEELSRSVQKLLATEIPAAISREITPAFEKARKDREGAAHETRELVGQKLDSIEQQIIEKAEATNDLFSSTISGQIKDLTQSINSAFEDVFQKNLSQSTKQAESLEQNLKELRTDFKKESTKLGDLVNNALAKDLKVLADIVTNKIDTLSETIKEHSAVSSQSLAKDLEDFKKTINALESVSAATPGEFTKSLQDFIGPAIDQRLSPLADLTEKISKQVSDTDKLLGETNQQLEKAVAVELQTRLSDFAKSILDELKTAFTQQTTSHASNHKSLFTSVETLQQKVEFLHDASSKEKDKAGKHLQEALQNLSRQMEEARNRQDETLTEDLQKHILKSSQDIFDAIQSLQKNIDSVKDTCSKETLTQSGAVAERLEDGLASLLQAFEKSSSQLQGDFNKFSRQINDAVKEKQLHASSNAAELNKIESIFRETLDPLRAEISGLKASRKEDKTGDIMGPLKSFFETNVIARITAMEEANYLIQKENEAARVQAEVRAKRQDDVLTSIVYTTKKLAKSSPETDMDISDKIEQAIDMSIQGMKEHLQLEKTTHHQVNSQLTKLIGEVEGTTKNQNDLLNSIFYAVKKLTSVYGQEKETSTRGEEQFETAILELNRLIRRLESQKDDAYTELIRFAGDDYFKSKLEEQAVEIKKANDLAEIRHQQNIELEKKLEQMQALWNDTAG